MSLALSTISPIRNEKMRVGLLGGSFNPAHNGHVHISKEAIKLLGLDYVVWLVTPQNPAKQPDMKSTFDARLIYAKHITLDIPQIIVSDFERDLPSPYTYESLTRLLELYPKVEFAWLMGADNMLRVDTWYKWRSIFESVFVAVFARPGYSENVLSCEAGTCYKRIELSKADSERRPLTPGFWCFFNIQPSSLSSTMLRDIVNDTTAFERDAQQYLKNGVKMSVDDLKEIILASLSADQAEDVLVLDVKQRSSFAIYMVILSGKSGRHIRAMTDNLMERLKLVNIGSSACGVETADWVLLDAGDIVVNLFQPEARELYKLEELWGS